MTTTGSWAEWAGRRGVVVGVVLVAVLATAGVAHAYWRATGSGAGSGPTGATRGVTLGPGTPAATLFPGGRSDVVLAVGNPGSAAVHVGSLVLDTTQGTDGFAVDAGHAGCAVSTLSYVAQDAAGAGWTVPGRAGGVDGTLSVTLTGALAMGRSALDACQAATFTVYLAVGP